MSVVDRIVDWLVPVAPSERLAVHRIAVAGFVTVYLLVRAPVFLGLAGNDPDRFAPVGVLAWLRSPLPDAAVTGLVAVTILLAALVTIGWRHRITGPTFAVAVLALFTYRSSWGQVLWFEILVVLHAVIVGFARSDDALSVSRSARRTHEPSIAYGWPIRLAALATVATYVLAGFAKLRYGGVDWFTDDSMRNHLAFSAARLEVLGATPSPIAGPIVGLPAVGGVVSWFVVAIELLAPVAFLGTRIRWLWIVATWTMHLLIAVTMFVVFPFPLLGIAFMPLVRTERLVAHLQQR